jgi:hypothetical protein
MKLPLQRASTPARIGPLPLYLTTRGEAREIQGVWPRNRGVRDTPSCVRPHSRFGAQCRAWVETVAGLLDQGIHPSSCPEIQPHAIRGDLAEKELASSQIAKRVEQGVLGLNSPVHHRKRGAAWWLERFAEAIRPSCRRVYGSEKELSRQGGLLRLRFMEARVAPCTGVPRSLTSS